MLRQQDSDCALLSVQTALTYVICYNNLLLHPFDAQLVGGGIGATTQTGIVLTSATGKLAANCDAYCK